MTPVWALPLLIVMQTRSAGVSPRPAAWAVQSPRPAACRGAPGLWEISRQAVVARRCRELSRAQALLIGAPARAKELSAALLAGAPELTEARVLRGRASLRVGDSATALADLSALLATDAAVADPSALWDGGRAALMQKDLKAAERFYRALGSRAALLPSRHQQVTAYLEIASVLLVSEPDTLDDALAYLREARRRASGTGLASLCAALTALSWRLEGREAEAQGALAEVTDAEGLERFRRGPALWLPEGLVDAALAVSLEQAEPELAGRYYQALATSPLAATKLAKLAARPRPGRGGRR